MNRKLRRQQAAIQKRIAKGAPSAEIGHQISQLTQALGGHEGVDNLGKTLGALGGLEEITEKLEPLVEQVEDLTEELVNTQEALQLALQQNEAIRQTLEDQRITFLWLIAEVADTPLEAVEQRYNQGFEALQRKRA